LVFKTIYQTQWDISFLHISIYSVLLLLGLIVLNVILNKILRIEGQVGAALILSTVFMNNGNLGVPLALLALGQKAFEYSVVIMIVHTILMCTVGIYVAARGKASWLVSVEKVIKNPVIYAVFLPIILRVFNIPFPQPLMSAVDIFAQGAIPLIMVALSMQLAEIKINKLDRTRIPLALTIRLIISPLMVAIALIFINIDPLLEKVMIIQAATPSAAITTIYAYEYDVLPDLVSSITFISTVVSMATLWLLLMILI
jgi:predicted permease